jgi:hypothetical protein
MQSRPRHAQQRSKPLLTHTKLLLQGMKLAHRQPMAHPLNQIRRLGFPDHRDDFLLNFAVFDALLFHKKQSIPSYEAHKHFPKKTPERRTIREFGGFLMKNGDR